MTNNYRLVCGMEVHAELKTNSKMFCGCKNDPFHAPQPNIYTCPTCIGLPGALPVANKKAIEWTIKLGIALNCQINLYSKFDRKHYFYPDLPKGYQISQYDLPFCHDGFVETSQGKVRIRRIHLEEDTAKLLHKTVDGEKVSLIDFNRSSVPLIEIVTEPDIKSAAQAKEYAKKLRKIIRYLDIADCDMEQGGMRLEANVSVQPSDKVDLPDYKIELKNINSFRFLEQAINYEQERQQVALENGEHLSQETRGWNSNNNTSFVQRIKEEAEDYRYFPDPDLPPVRFSENDIKKIADTIPELPEQVSERWAKTHGIDHKLSSRLITNQQSVDKYDQLFKLAKQNQIEITKLVNQIINKQIKVNFDDLENTLQSFKAANQTDDVDQSELDSIIKNIIDNNQDAVERYRSGQKQVIGFFMGQVMQQLKIKADPQQVKQALHKQLDN